VDLSLLPLAGGLSFSGLLAATDAGAADPDTDPADRAAAAAAAARLRGLVVVVSLGHDISVCWVPHARAAQAFAPSAAPLCIRVRQALARAAGVPVPAPAPAPPLAAAEPPQSMAPELSRLFGLRPAREIDSERVGAGAGAGSGAGLLLVSERCALLPWEAMLGLPDSTLRARSLEAGLRIASEGGGALRASGRPLRIVLPSPEAVAPIEDLPAGAPSLDIVRRRCALAANFRELDASLRRPALPTAVADGEGALARAILAADPAAPGGLVASHASVRLLQSMAGARGGADELLASLRATSESPAAFLAPDDWAHSLRDARPGEPFAGPTLTPAELGESGAAGAERISPRDIAGWRHPGGGGGQGEGDEVFVLGLADLALAPLPLPVGCAGVFVERDGVRAALAALREGNGRGGAAQTAAQAAAALRRCGFSCVAHV
jgi:hypothetical protein